MDLNDSSLLEISCQEMAKFAVEYYDPKYKEKVQVQQFGD
jgi:hypothetical protein